MAGVADFPIFFVVEAKADQAIASFQKLNLEMDKMAEKGLVAGGVLGKFQAAGKVAGTALLGIGTIFAGVAYESVKAAMDVASSQATLKTAIQDTGVSYTQAEPAVEQMVQKMANLTFASSDTMQALASMTAATRSPMAALEAMGTVADLAAFQHESLAAAADTVSRATLGQARGLSTLGLAINKTIPKGATYTEILQLIQERTKGAAKAAADAQPWKVLQANLKLVEEQVGGPLLGDLAKLSTYLTKDGKLQKLGQSLKDNMGIIKDISIGLAGLWATSKLITFYNFLKKVKSTFGEIKAGVSDSYASIEDFFKAFSQDSALMGDLKVIGGIFGSIAEAVGKFLGPIGALITGFTDIIAFLKGGTPVRDKKIQIGSPAPSMAESLHDLAFGAPKPSKPTSKPIDYLSPAYLNTLQGKTGSLASIMATIAAEEKKAGGKVSIKKAEKGLTTYSTSTGLQIKVNIDGSKATINSIKYSTSKAK